MGDHTISSDTPEIIKLRKDIITLSDIMCQIIGHIDTNSLSIESRANVRVLIKEFGELVSRMKREEIMNGWH